MALKIIIAVLFLAVILSLGSSFYLLSKDRGTNRRRGVHALGIRVLCAALLLGAVAYGIATGQLGTQQLPWEEPLSTAPLVPAGS